MEYFVEVGVYVEADNESDAKTTVGEVLAREFETASYDILGVSECEDA